MAEKKKTEVLAPARHSDVVGGSTAKRVIACPGSVALCAQMPKLEGSSYAKEGSMLHAVIAACLDENTNPDDMLGFELDGVVLTKELIEGKLRPALNALDEEIDPEAVMEFAVEQEVSFGKFLPGAFGSVDLIGRRGDTAIVLDWKFGSGVQVSAEKNAQPMFYAAAAMRTEATKWAFEDATEVEIVIIQPPGVSRWTCTFSELAAFERGLKAAVKESEKPDAKLSAGEHCRWCAAKTVCPLMTGAVDRALQTDLKAMDVAKLGLACRQADLLEGWIKDLRALVQTALENGVAVPGWKLVAKRGTRQWVNEEAMVAAMTEQGLTFDDITEQKFRSPAQVEKVLKAKKLTMPEGLVAMVSSGHTLAPEDDKRPSVDGMIKLAEALKKL